ncbi:hypothetical protein QA600_18495 [Natronococcus sp. A-GB1]|uniref:hypothetical protein n=1 Tax=Natronococcus sp. A-GB1 TaxID=3037648 RepID=UPI00241FBEF9|nr:hypothetical protein [Natronococcus sp. A-GB1]MDG5761323.1 hypothetical protein [Natronococcus sp. A-GB1]
MIDAVIGAIILLALLWGTAELTADPGDNETPPSLWSDLLLALAFVYILRYLRQHQD